MSMVQVHQPLEALIGQELGTRSHRQVGTVQSGSCNSTLLMLLSEVMLKLVVFRSLVCRAQAVYFFSRLGNLWSAGPVGACHTQDCSRGLQN